MTSSLAPVRRAVPRRYLMCRPTYFSVRYAINPWMDPARLVDVTRACAQWEALRALYHDLGHTVELINPLPDLPDMVFAANGGLVVDGQAVGVRFRHPQRRGEETPYLRRLATLAPRGAYRPSFVNEGEGDFLSTGAGILAGAGFRTEPAVHAEVARILGRPVRPLRLVDPRFYHLDTALCVVADDLVAYLPRAFDAPSCALLTRLFPDAITVGERDAAVFGLNAVSDGLHVVLPADADEFVAALRCRGFEPIGIVFDELRRGGGGIKCATLELRG
jgi:N-dimethylarginine dimethylaminohydrolase